MANILIADDMESIRDALKATFAINGHNIALAASGEEAITLIQEDIFDIAIADIRMGEVGGLDFLRTIKEVSPDTEVIMMTGYATVDMAVESMKLGSYDFVTKPINIEELLLLTDKILEKRELTHSVRALRTQVKGRYKFTDIVGNAPAMLSIFASMEIVCQFDSAVLVTGESGTGKELVASAIHDSSPRRDRPFMPINCAALPENIQESELFGHAKGAFTDAVDGKAGLFAEADRGTVFLDEIGEATPPTQAKLLRFLQNGEIRRVGENLPIHVDARLIAASNKDLWEAVQRGTFREDLYYRINVIRIHLPPLRRRKDDIPLLVHHFVQKYAHRAGKNIDSVSREALSLLMEYDWPGNVRELQNAIQHAIAFTSDNTISPSSLPPHVQAGGEDLSPQNENEWLSLYDLKKTYTLKVLEESSWNCKKTAGILGVGRATIYRKLKEYDVSQRTEQSPDTERT